MTQSGHPAARGPARRGDSTRPPNPRTGSRRFGDRRPYPTAATTTRLSPAKPGSANPRTRSRGSAATPTPATVWTAGAAAIDLDAAWPIPIISKIVGSFSQPGGRVALLPWPTPSQRPRLAPVRADGVIDSPITTAPDADSDEEVADALAAVEGLDRSCHVVRVAADPALAGPGSRPFWADLVGDRDHPPATVSQHPDSDVGGEVIGGEQAAPADTDLIITSLRPEHGGDRASDLVALLAARLLQVGGILVVLTHCDWPVGELIDPTGTVVAAAQNADLLYLQHIVALHTPVRGGRFALDVDGPAAETEARARHRATVRGLPAPHRRVHSDVLVFAQPHDYQPPQPSPSDAASETGVLR